MGVHVKFRFQKLTLQRKILYTVILLSMITVLTIVVFITYKDYQYIVKNKSDLSLQTSKSLSYMDKTQNLMEDYTFHNYRELNVLLDHIKNQVDAGFIYVIDKSGHVLSHTDKKYSGGEKDITVEYQAIVYGGSYTSKDVFYDEQAIFSVSPIMMNEQQVLGAVVVGYLIEDIHKELLRQIMSLLKVATVILLLGIIVSVLLARNIRRDTFGMEPSEIAVLYKDRHTILSSMGEGLIALDDEGKVTLINDVAKRMLNITSDCLDESVDSILPNGDRNMNLLEKKERTYEINLNNIPVILRSVPLENNSGSIITIVDKTEITELKDALDAVKRYADDLRAQTHEFSNKLYVILGLTQLGEYEKVLDMITEEIEINEYSNRIIFEQIEDRHVQAILLGKISKASEKKVKFHIDENSHLSTLPAFIKRSHLTTIIGNLLDNAIEAVLESDNKTITFFALDYGNDIIFEVSDGGKGIDKQSFNRLFEKGFSTKKSNSRGYGLVNVKRKLEELSGSIEVHSDDNGTTFTVYIPKSGGEQ